MSKKGFVEVRLSVPLSVHSLVKREARTSEKEKTVVCRYVEILKEYAEFFAAKAKVKKPSCEKR